MKNIRKPIEDIILKLNPDIKREKLNWREDYRLEIICDHGIGHTVFSPRGKRYFVHGCDECCKYFTIIEVLRIKIKSEKPKLKK